MRQVGIIAQAGIIALEKMTKRLSEDRENAVYMAELIKTIPGVEVHPEDVHINMVFLKINKNIDLSGLQEALKKEGILINPPENGKLRLVTHYYIGRTEVEKVARTLRAILAD